MARAQWEKDCTMECERVVRCSVCERRKPPRGRSVPMEMSGSYCERECPGFEQPPLGGHLWPGELADMDREDGG